MSRCTCGEYAKYLRAAEAQGSQRNGKKDDVNGFGLYVCALHVHCSLHTYNVHVHVYYVQRSIVEVHMYTYK